MNDLPDPGVTTGNNQPSINSPTQPQDVAVLTPTIGKETEPGGINPEGLKDATGQELELPKEVATSGVRIQPTTIQLPASVAQMGVKPTAGYASVQTQRDPVLPLTDEQIVSGLHVGIIHSWRWLSEWCVKRLKQLHIAIQSASGKTIRVKI